MTEDVLEDWAQRVLLEGADPKIRELEKRVQRLEEELARSKVEFVDEDTELDELGKELDQIAAMVPEAAPEDLLVGCPKEETSGGKTSLEFTVSSNELCPFYAQPLEESCRALGVPCVDVKHESCLLNRYSEVKVRLEELDNHGKWLRSA